MAYNDLSESKVTVSAPYGPCRGADFYKNDTLSRSRKPENDTLFSGTSPYRKIYKCLPPWGTKIFNFVDSSLSSDVYSILYNLFVNSLVDTLI